MRIHEIRWTDRPGCCVEQKSGQITEPMKHVGTIHRDLSCLVRVLNRIDDPSARKAVVMSKWERKQITGEEAVRLIRLCHLEAA